jgi:hypothetical protein
MPADCEGDTTIQLAIKKYIQVTTEKLGIHPIEFEEWRHKLMEKV